MKRYSLTVSLLLLACHLSLAEGLSPAREASLAQKYQPLNAPKVSRLVLRPGDRLAICGDSITEQRMYSRIIEDYLTMCVPDLNVTVRQYGWSGERAPGFLARMTNDCLRFYPTIATTCYGMNDHQYRPYQEEIGRMYRDTSKAIIEAFEARGVAVIQGSPGCVGKVPGWVRTANGTVDDLNLSLCKLRNAGIEVARAENAGFADVFWPMITAGAAGKSRYGTNYAIAGADGVHPGWAGHTVMAYAFLKSFGLNGEIGAITVDLRRNEAEGTKGHAVSVFGMGEISIRSTRYPFCPCLDADVASGSYPVCGQDDPTRDNSIQSAMTLIPFNQELNRFMLTVKNAEARKYRVSWGEQRRTFTAKQLERGINLAEEFPCNPFSKAFGKVDAAVAAKQEFETKQVKQVFHGAEGKADMQAAVVRTEQERTRLAAAIEAAFVPVTHILRIVAE